MTSNIELHPRVGIFWAICPLSEPVQIISTSCGLEDAELYGDCLTFGPGHFEIWSAWQKSGLEDPSARALVRAYEYEAWPRGRIVYDRTQDCFNLYCDRKMMNLAMINEIILLFFLPVARTNILADTHYQSEQNISCPN